MLNNVKDFGAHGDGVTDDRAAIQAAIDDAVTHNKAGILFPAGTYRTSRNATDRCSLNLNGVQDFMIVGFANLPEHSLVVGGATSHGGTTASSGTGRFITGQGNPNSKVTGNVGDIFQRLDGTPGATLYVKETGNGTNTGWTAK